MAKEPAKAVNKPQDRSELQASTMKPSLVSRVDSISKIRNRHPGATPERLVEELEKSLASLPEVPRLGVRPVFLHIQVTPATVAFARDLVQELRHIEQEVATNAIPADNPK